jgi:hypothetical protein
MLDPEFIERLPVVKVPIASLIPADSPRQKGEDPRHVQRLAESGEALPPIIVNRATMQVIDGMHRLSVARLRGQGQIDARLYEGDQASAFVLAVRANVTHGLPLSLADRKFAAQRILSAYPQWSDRSIALATGLAAGTVARLRTRLTAHNEQLDARVGRDGKARPLDTAKRRAKAAELMQAAPGSTLREIARQAGISPETARAVRTGLSSAAPATPSGGRRLPGKAQDPRARNLEAVRDAPEVVAQTLDAGRLISSLQADPAVRSSEIGRLLLRALTISVQLGDNSAKLKEILPEYRRDDIALAIQAAMRAWLRCSNQFGQDRKTADEANG